MKKHLLAGLLLTTANFSFSEDIELYISDTVTEASSRPQVLIIFDDSGSMGINETVKASYDPNINYDAVADNTMLAANYIYYTQGQVEISEIPIADETDEQRKFLLAISNCKVAQDIIDQYGFYTGQIREYTFQGNSGRWSELDAADGSSIVITDCEDDVVAENNNNKNYLDNGVVTALLSGYPVDGEGDADTPQFYASNVADSNVEWSGSLVTLYSDNYLRWYHGDEENAKIGWQTKQRIEIAKESVTNLINSVPNVDFGLQVFNYDFADNQRNGGRIVFGITESTVTSRANLIDIVDNQIHAQGNTPLCETLYEASLYFAGKNVDFGDDDQNYNSHGYTANVPPRDTTIESGNVYQSPFSSCSDKAYVILITDGVPTMDTNADNKVIAIPESDQDDMGSPYNLNGTDNYLAALAGWMNNNDLNTSVDGKQTVATYTIGFALDDDENDQDTAEPLLQETADLGGGKYFSAQDTASLTAALINVLANLEPINDSLTSASVAANNFDRTETLNSVYYAMFQPDIGPRWQGNLKKYKVINSEQQGKNGKAALNDDTGHFATDVTSYWSNEIDGDQVAEGGVADMLRNKTNRVLYSDIGGSDGTVFDELTMTKLTAAGNYFGSQAQLALYLGVDENEVEENINWAQGIDVDDEDDDGDTSDMRYDVFGDPLHSKPLVINYGDSIYLVIGTNSGALHMFEDSEDTVDETWAFMPKEFFSNIEKLRDNYTTDNKVYGVDGQITSHTYDANGNGIIEDGDTVWIFFGVRRGGTSYYGIDISNPNSPSLLWHIDADTAGFSELGQSWSQPVVSYSKINIVGGVAKPVLFFGGGYDTSKDNTGVGADDNVGRAIYMVDAETGSLKWSMAPENATTIFNGTDSIPSSIATLDSDGDGLADRLYVGDTGGNVWRVDMPSDDPTGSYPWSVFNLASLGSDITNADDRRFFYEPAIVRTFISETIEEQITDANGDTSQVIVQQEIPYDAVLLGSGDRSNPLGTDTNDIFFMIKDNNITTQTFSADTTPSTPIARVVADLSDFTDDPFGTVSDEGLQALSVAVSEQSGWFFSLELEGEKSTSSGIVINSIVYFTTFSPPDLSGGDVEGCDVPSGEGWLYAVDLAQGISKYSWSEDDANREDRIAYISEQFLGSPTLIVIPEDDGDPATVDPTVGNLIVGREMISVGFNLQTMRTYLYVTEDNQ